VLQYLYMVDNNILIILKSVLNKYLDKDKYKIFIFGSRTRPKHRKFCDLDIGILGSPQLSALTLLQIKEDLSNSDIPYLADVVDFSTVSKDFKEKALSNIIII
jgi:uncharacterized protein